MGAISLGAKGQRHAAGVSKITAHAHSRPKRRSARCVPTLMPSMTQGAQCIDAKRLGYHRIETYNPCLPSSLWNMHKIRRILHLTSAGTVKLFILIVASGYMPCTNDAATAENKRRLRERLNLAQPACAGAIRRCGNTFRCSWGDFNGHDEMWGGDRVTCSYRQGEGTPILDWMAGLGPTEPSTARNEDIRNKWARDNN